MKLVVVPLAPVTFQKSAQNDTCTSSIMLKRRIINTKGNVGATVNQVTTNELASFESNKRLKTNMHTLKANHHNTLMLISYRLSYFLLPCVYVFYAWSRWSKIDSAKSLKHNIAPDGEHVGEQYVYQQIPDPISFHHINSNPTRRSTNARAS